MSGILDLNGKVALITGAGQGVGRQIALHYAAHGADGVVVNDFFDERARAVADEITALGGKAVARFSGNDAPEGDDIVFGRAKPGRQFLVERADPNANLFDAVVRFVRERQAAGKKVVMHKPPQKGFVHWDKGTFERLVNGTPEPLASRFEVTHGMLLNILNRPSDGCRAAGRLIRDSHEPESAKKAQRIRAWQLFRALVARRVVA